MKIVGDCYMNIECWEFTARSTHSKGAPGRNRVKELQITIYIFINHHTWKKRTLFRKEWQIAKEFKFGIFHLRMYGVVGERITYQEGWGKKHCVVKVHSLHRRKILQEANHIWSKFLIFKTLLHMHVSANKVQWQSFKVVV